MRSARLKCLVGLSATVLVVAWGCGEAPPPERATEATVKGTVTLNGRLAKTGKVTFDAGKALPGDANISPIGSDGSYSVKALVGENRVIVEAPETKRDPLMGQTNFMVNEGENTFNIVLPPGP